MALNAGSIINPHSGYDGETHALYPGQRSWSMIGLAIIDPEQPSRDIAFILPARQKGRPNKIFTIPAGSYVTRASVRIPNKVVLGNGAYEIAPVAGAAEQIQVAYAPPVAASDYDYVVSWALVPHGSFGIKRVEAQADTAPGNGQQLITSTPSTNGALLAEATILVDSSVANGDPLAADWSPHWITPGAVPFPATSSGKKEAVVLEVSGYYLDATATDMETAVAGVVSLGV